MVGLLGSMVACLPEAEPVRDDSMVVEVTDAWRLDLHADLPTDLLDMGDGGFAVLDGYQERIVRYNSAHEPSPLVGHGWKRPVRMAKASAGGWWLVQPADGLLRVDVEGAVQQQLTVEVGGAVEEPIAVLDLGAELVVSTRMGDLVWLDASSGDLKRRIDKDVDGKLLGTITDLVLTPQDGIAAVDTLSHKIHLLDRDGTMRSGFGQFGMWAGYLHKPKGIAFSAGAAVVADSALGVQVFAPGEGQSWVALGLVGQGGEPLDFSHAIAAESVGDQVLVLDTDAHAIWGFKLTPEAVAHSREAADVRALREPLADNKDHVAGIGRETCWQCHDGLINDSREVFDPNLMQHPVDMVPEMTLPVFFPLDSDGKMRCITCHTPHGASTLEDVKGLRSVEDIEKLVRTHEPRSQFTRMRRDNSALCVACHSEEPHKEAAGKSGGHPTGSELVAQLEKLFADDPELAKDLPKGCLACHAVHGAGDKLSRSDEAGGVCVSCHQDRGDPGHTSHPLGRLASTDGGVKPREDAKIPVVGGKPMCISCHDLVKGRGDSLLRRPDDGGLLCMACHQDHDKDEDGGHGAVRGEQRIPCLGCHAVHNAPVPDKHLLRLADQARAKDPAACLGCHKPGGAGSKRGVSPGRLGHPVTGKRFAKGVLTCMSCHTPHVPEPGEKAVCARCHEKQKARIDAGGHGKATCQDCHNTHQSNRRAGSSTINPRSRRCLGCHSKNSRQGDAPVVPDFQHPDLRMPKDRGRSQRLSKLRFFDKRGRVLPAKAVGDITCNTCHRIHGPEPGDTLDKLRIPGIKDACAVCHGDDIDLRYRWVHEPDRRAGLEVWD